jgi:hypothetical protein
VKYDFLYNHIFSVDKKCCTESSCCNVSKNIACENQCGKGDSCKNNFYNLDTRFGFFKICDNANKGKIVITTRRFEQNDFIVQYVGTVQESFDREKHDWNRYK